VLVPRPETETLVHWALELAGTLAEPSLVDLGTGSGAIALALKADCPAAQVTATDASGAALGVARCNAARLGICVGFASGDWWEAVGSARFDLAVSNPPYIAVGDPHLPALAHEPASALTAGAEGLDAIRVIIGGAPRHLRRGGWLLLEHGHEQADDVAQLLMRHGFTSIQTRRDLAGAPRCTGGRVR
jgi:release factor glutamine methyltransferase